ncbi:MAG: ribonuclease III [Armatimonadota bacterium]
MFATDQQESLAGVLAQLGIERNPLLDRALCHSSCAREAGMRPDEANERLEFLGDAVLDLIVAGHLYRTHPYKTEGELTKIKAVVVSQDTLARRAGTLGIGHRLRLGKGEEELGCRTQSSILASAFEAVIAAVYLTHGLQAARDFTLRTLGPDIAEIADGGYRSDFKSALQELTQNRAKSTPDYVVVERLGPPHDRTFFVEARFRNKAVGRGVGKSKREAEQEAAREALTTAHNWVEDDA